MITKEEVEVKRYKNSEKVPEVDDVVDTGYEKQVVGQLGGCMTMFQNCTFGSTFVLTHPEECTLVKGA
jgi:hypothetical protein